MERVSGGFTTANCGIGLMSLVREVGLELAELGYAQTPLLVAPSEIKKSKIPLSVG